MSVPVLLPGDWVWISFGYTHHGSWTSDRHREVAVREGREFARKFNQMGVYLLGYSANPDKIGMSVDVVFRNGVEVGPDGQPGHLPWQGTS